MVLDNLGSSLRKTLKRIASASHVDKGLIREVVKDIQRALLQADVNVKLVLDITQRIEKRALEGEPPSGMSHREHVIRIVYDELVAILGEVREVPIKKQRILMVGLYGQGKTTTCGKLALYFQKKGLKVGLIAADVHRPAAYHQLKQNGDRVRVPTFGDPKAKDAVKVVRDGLKHFSDMDVVIIDTAGRHSLEDELIAEVESIAKAAEADERFLVMDAAVGQQAGPQAKAFHDAVKVSGVIITKLDGTAKGGGALSAVAATKAPVVFIGLGEHMDDFEKFDPPRFISRLLGMGDIQTLLEKAKEVMDEEEAEDAARKMLSGKFTLLDMYHQMEMLTHMGPLKRIMSMLPFGGAQTMSDQEMERTQERLARFRVIMDSMTKEELENPRMIKVSRIKRIALGSGVDPKEVRELLKYYETSQKAMKGLTSNRKVQRRLMKQLRMSGVDLGG